MGPKVPVSVLFFKYWMERLENCCHYCGELQEIADNDKSTDQDFSKKEQKRHHHHQHQQMHQQQQRYKQQLKYQQQQQQQQQQQNNLHQSLNFAKEKLPENSTVLNIWQPWQEKSSDVTSKQPRFRKSPKQTPVRLVYHKKPYDYHFKEAEMLLWQLPFQATIEVIADNNSEAEEKIDEEKDLMDDLRDAWDHLESNKKSQQ